MIREQIQYNVTEVTNLKSAILQSNILPVLLENNEIKEVLTAGSVVDSYGSKTIECLTIISNILCLIDSIDARIPNSFNKINRIHDLIRTAECRADSLYNVLQQAAEIRRES